MNDIYLAKGEKVVAYLDKENEQLSLFPAASIEVILWSRNSNVDALTKLALTRDADLLDAVFMEFVVEPSINPQQRVIELTQYLKTDE